MTERKQYLIWFAFYFSIPFLMMLYLLLNSPDYMVNLFKSIDAIRPFNGFWIVVILNVLMVMMFYVGLQKLIHRKILLNVWIGVFFFALGFPSIWVIFIYPSLWMLMNAAAPPTVIP